MSVKSLLKKLMCYLFLRVAPEKCIIIIIFSYYIYQKKNILTSVISMWAKQQIRFYCQLFYLKPEVMMIILLILLLPLLLLLALCCFLTRYQVLCRHLIVIWSEVCQLIEEFVVSPQSVCPTSNPPMQSTPCSRLSTYYLKRGQRPTWPWALTGVPFQQT